MDPNDEHFVRQSKQELPYNTTAFEALLRRYEHVVFRTCLRYLRNEQEAEEACQDVFLRVFHALPDFEQRSSFRTWLFRIVVNRCASRWGILKKRAAKDSELIAAAQHALPVDREPDPQDFDEVTGVVGEGLELLAPDDRHVLILRHISELSFEELAETLDIGLSAAKMRLYRAEQRLRAAYEQVRTGTHK